MASDPLDNLPLCACCHVPRRARSPAIIERESTGPRGGARLRIRLPRLFVYPRVSVRRLEQGDGGSTTAVLTVDGLVCDVCAARAQRALANLPGATAANVDLESGAGTVTFAGQPASEEALAKAVEGQVLLRPARRWLARFRRKGRT